MQLQTTFETAPECQKQSRGKIVSTQIIKSLTAHFWIFIRTVTAIIFSIAKPSPQDATAIFAFEFISITGLIYTK